MSEELNFISPDAWQQREKLEAILNRILLVGVVLFVTALPISIAICQSALGLAYAAWIGKMILHGHRLVSRTPLDYFFLAYLVVEIWSLIFSQDRWTSLIYFRRMLLIPIVYLAADNVASERFAKLLIAALIGVMAILGIWGIYKYLGGPGGLAGRVSLRQHYMTSGGLLMMVGAFSVAYAVSSAPWRIRLCAAFATLSIILTMIFTYTRSSWLGFIGSLIIIGMILSRKTIAVFLLAAALLLALGPADLRDRAMSIVDPQHARNLERTYMWQSGLAIIRDYPWTGVGDIDFNKIYARYKSPQARESAGHLHNNFLMLGATLGLPGLLAMLALFARIIAVELNIVRRVAPASWFCRSTAVAAFACFIGFQINGLFEWNFGDTEIAMLLWFTIGLALAVERLAKLTPSPQQSSSTHT